MIKILNHLARAIEPFREVRHFGMVECMKMDQTHDKNLKRYTRN